MRNTLWIGSFFAMLVATTLGCGGVDNPFQSTPTATSSRISVGDDNATSDEVVESTVIFNDRLDISSGDLVNPIPSLEDRTAGIVDDTNDDDGSVEIWPDEVRNPDDAPTPDDVIDSGGGDIHPDEVIESNDDDGLVSEVVDATSSDVDPDDVVDSGDDNDDGDIWGEVID